MLAATAATAVDSGHWIYFQHVFARPFRVLRVCYVGSLLPEWHYYPINMVCLILFILLFTSLSVRSRMKMTHYALVQCPQYYLSLYYRQLKRERERETPDNFYFPFTSLHRSNASFWGIYSILIDIYLSHNNAHKMCVCVWEFEVLLHAKGEKVLWQTDGNGHARRSAVWCCNWSWLPMEAATRPEIQ